MSSDFAAVPPAYGWSVQQAIDEISHGKTLAEYVPLQQEHAYQVKMGHWRNAGSPMHSVGWEYYLNLGERPHWTLDQAGAPRETKQFELPPNPLLAAAARATVNLMAANVGALLKGLRSGDLVCAGAKGHPTNSVDWLPSFIWSNYLPNIPMNEARWSTALETDNFLLMLREVFDPAREKKPGSFFDTTYFRLLILKASDIKATPGTGTVDIPPAVKTFVASNGAALAKKLGINLAARGAAEDLGPALAKAWTDLGYPPREIATFIRETRHWLTSN